MLNKVRLTYFLSLGFFLGIAVSCYQKKSPKNEKLIISQEDKFPDDTLVSGIHPDSLEYVDTFQLVTTETIFKGIQNNSKRKLMYKLPQLRPGDSLQDYEYIENIALTNVYASVGRLSSNQKLFQASLSKNEELFSKIIEDSLEFPQKPTIDSLNKWTEYAFNEHTSQSEWVYYEAIQWLEHLYLTIENPQNSKNKKKLEELVMLQLENGTEMAQRLSAYQDYPPILVFSEYLINILDCKYYTFDVTQLRNVVIEARDHIYIPKEENK